MSAQAREGNCSSSRRGRAACNWAAASTSPSCASSSTASARNRGCRRWYCRRPPVPAQSPPPAGPAGGSRPPTPARSWPPARGSGAGRGRTPPAVRERRRRRRRLLPQRLLQQQQGPAWPGARASAWRKASTAPSDCPASSRASADNTSGEAAPGLRTWAASVMRRRRQLAPFQVGARQHQQRRGSWRSGCAASRARSIAVTGRPGTAPARPRWPGAAQSIDLGPRSVRSPATASSRRSRATPMRSPCGPAARVARAARGAAAWACHGRRPVRR